MANFTSTLLETITYRSTLINERKIHNFIILLRPPCLYLCTYSAAAGTITMKMVMHNFSRATKAPIHSSIQHSWLSHRNCTQTIQTSRVSLPPTMLRPSPLFPLLISMVVSWPGIMGQEAGSCMTTAAERVSDGRWRAGDDAEKTGVTETAGTDTGWWTGDGAACAGDWWADEALTCAGELRCWRAGDDVWTSEISDVWFADTSVTKTSLWTLVYVIACRYFLSIKYSWSSMSSPAHHQHHRHCHLRPKAWI